MTLGLILTVILWAACLSSAGVAVSGYAQMARTKGGWREAAAWTAPLVFTSVAFGLLTALGILGLTFGLPLAVAPLAVVAVRAARLWSADMRLEGSLKATRLVLGLLGARLRDATWNAREDARDLGGRLRPAAPPAAPVPYSQGTTPAALSAPRAVPPLRANGSLGAAPSAVEVGLTLEAAGVAVPPEFAAVADMIRDFDPDDDEDELLAFVAGLAAGFLFVSEAFPDLAETLMTGTGLDPVYAIGFVDVSEEVAAPAEAFALLDRQYHDTYEGIHDHVDSGKTLPHNSRRYFHAEGGATDGGTAA